MKVCGRILEEHTEIRWHYGNWASDQRAEFAGGFAMPDSGSVPRRIQDQYLTRLRSCRRHATVVLVAAPIRSGTGLLQRAARALDLDVGALDWRSMPACWTSVRGCGFGHPSAALGGLSGRHVEERRIVHAALAAATEQSDPDRRAWHRAYAAGPSR